MEKTRNGVGPAEGPRALGASSATEPGRRIIESGIGYVLYYERNSKGVRVVDIHFIPGREEYFSKRVIEVEHDNTLCLWRTWKNEWTHAVKTYLRIRLDQQSADLIREMLRHVHNHDEFSMLGYLLALSLRGQRQAGLTDP